MQRDFELDQCLDDMAQAQKGLVTSSQVRGFGGSRDQVDRRIAQGALIRETRKVLRYRSAPLTWEQQAKGATLQIPGGSVTTGRTCAALWSLPGYPRREIEVLTTIRKTHDLPGATVRRTRMLPPEHCVILEGIPTLTPARLLWELAASEHPDRVARTYDNALSMELVTGARMRAMLDFLGKRGRQGTTLWRTLLNERDDEYVPPASGLESRFLQIIEGRFPAPRRQVDLGDQEEWIGRVDFLFDPWPLICEVNSSRHHTARLDRLADEERYRKLSAAGLEVVLAWSDDVFRYPSKVLDELGGAFQRVGAPYR
ncbi:MAG TPA: hypothetical protein VMY34_05355 [Acidimicrobiales bacterium]|nr:hypothetical protein [Acidimicrobiales bacterium]